MKFLPAQLAFMLDSGSSRRNLRLLSKFLLALGAMIATYSILFHALMDLEGQEHTWITGVYWTLTVMSTLGFGDITFQSDIGRVFSVVVLVSGVMFLLVVLPFTFIEFFYAPWLEAQRQSRAPRSVPPATRDHVISRTTIRSRWRSSTVSNRSAGATTCWSRTSPGHSSWSTRASPWSSANATMCSRMSGCARRTPRSSSRRPTTT
jgi:hypothetical protein